MDPSQYSAGTQGSFPGTQPQVEDPRSLITFKTISDLQIIAQRIGGDFNMSVEIGKAGGGSYFDTVNCKITLDPLHILQDPGMARFVAGHEGSHRAITMNSEDLGLSKEQVQNLYSRIGFAYIQNIIEDGAVNDWMVNTAPGMEEDTRNFYDNQFADPKAILSTPEVVKVARQLGYWPRFAQFGSEILRDWHAWRKEIGSEKPLLKGQKGRFAPDLDPAVEAALNKSLDHAHEAISSIPRAGSRDHEHIKIKHQKRFKICAEKVYSEARKLVELDLDTEMNRQTLNDVMQKIKELLDLQDQMQQQQQGQSQGQQAGQQQPGGGGQPQSSGQPQGKQPVQQPSAGAQQPPSAGGPQASASGKPQSGTSSQDEMQQRIEELEEALDQYNALPEDTKKEIQDAIDSAVEEEANDLLNDLQEKAQQIRESKEKQEQLEAQGKTAEAKIEEAKQEQLKQAANDHIDDTLCSEEKKQELKDTLEESSEDKSSLKKDLLKDDKLKNELKEELKDQKTKEGSLPYPEEKLSDETKEAIKGLKDQASPEEQQAREERAEKALKKFEDKVNESIESKLQQNKNPSHKQQDNPDKGQGEDGDQSEDEADQDGENGESADSSDSDSQSSSSSSPRNTRDLKADTAEFERIRRELEVASKAEMSQFDQGRLAVQPHVGKLLRRIRKALHPEEADDFQADQQTGRVNLRDAMRSETDINAKRRVFEDLVEPLELNHAFLDLYDVSGSMDQDGKIIENFKAAILNATVFDRLKIPYAAYRFHDKPEPLKTFDQKFSDPDVKARIGSVLKTLGGTNDAFALGLAYEEISKRPEKFLFIRVFTDAQSGQETALRELIERIKKEKRVVVIHYGLGEGTEDRLKIYPYSYPNLKMEVTPEENAQGVKPFIEVLPDTTEKMLKQPDRYFGYKKGDL